MTPVKGTTAFPTAKVTNF